MDKEIALWEHSKALETQIALLNAAYDAARGGKPGIGYTTYEQMDDEQLEKARVIAQSVRAFAEEQEDEVELAIQRRYEAMDVNPDPDPVHLAALLGLVGIDVSSRETEAWTPEQRKEAGAWAATEHLIASDHDELRPLPFPAFLEPYRATSTS